MLPTQYDVHDWVYICNNFTEFQLRCSKKVFYANDHMNEFYRS